MNSLYNLARGNKKRKFITRTPIKGASEVFKRTEFGKQLSPQEKKSTAIFIFKYI